MYTCPAENEVHSSSSSHASISASVSIGCHRAGYASTSSTKLSCLTDMYDYPGVHKIRSLVLSRVRWYNCDTSAEYQCKGLIFLPNGWPVITNVKIYQFRALKQHTYWDFSNDYSMTVYSREGAVEELCTIPHYSKEHATNPSIFSLILVNMYLQAYLL